MEKKHFIALVPMGGKYEGRIAQNSTMQENIEDAAKWAKGRFNRSSIIVEMNDGEDSLPTNGWLGNRNIYMVSLNIYFP